LSTLDGDQKSREDGTVAKLNFTYKFDNDRLVYATYSEGFRVGGSNPLKPESILPRDYKSDDLQNFELGAKSEWLNNRLRLNIAAYYMKWNDFAVQIEDPSDFFQLGFVNLPSAKIPGVEAEFAVTVNDEWQVDGSVAWNDAQIDQATTLVLTDDFGTDYPFTVSDGARLPLAPDWSAALGVEYHSSAARLLNARPFARLDLAYVGESLNSLEGIESIVSGNPVETQAAYDTGDLRFGLEGESWSASIFVDNLWDERANLFVSNRWAKQRQSINRPRTIGVQFRYEF
jgi:outer membrane receptor protein involved in Fe transport